MDTLICPAWYEEGDERPVAAARADPVGGQRRGQTEEESSSLVGIPAAAAPEETNQGRKEGQGRGFLSVQ